MKVRGDLRSLTTIALFINKLYLALGLVNWIKSKGIWTGAEQDTSTRYLGFQVGMDVSPMQQFAHVLESIWKKLTYWSTTRLSLACRALVLN